tara:strand:- start:465 stop:1238 length:774 start_codon:yes stop_codon:yes gene_type:complete
MDGKKIFELLVQYHIDVDLPRCVKHIRDGRVMDPTDHEEPFEAPNGENSCYKGILIVSNGPTLSDELIENDLVDGRDIGSFVRVDGDQAFRNYLDEAKKQDGAHLYTGASNQMARVSELNNHSNCLEGRLDLTRVPGDFVYADGRGVQRSDLGTRTRLAIRIPSLPQFKHVEMFQIKQTGYNDLGIGKVTYFNQSGLSKEFFFQYNAEDESIEGVWREYSMRNETLTCVNEEIKLIHSLKPPEPYTQSVETPTHLAA